MGLINTYPPQSLSSRAASHTTGLSSIQIQQYVSRSKEFSACLHQQEVQHQHGLQAQPHLHRPLHHVHPHLHQGGLPDTTMDPCPFPPVSGASPGFPNIPLSLP